MKNAEQGAAGGPTLKQALRLTGALADGQRVRIVMMLRGGELCVCQIVALLALAPSTVSKHLSILSAAGLVDSRKDGRWAYYRLPQGPAGAAVRALLRWLCGALADDAAIRQDARKLKGILACNPEILCRRQRKRK
jgi:ArsR family transcriptional regulator, arsenate/arsenite/antimonite-responsive transcriptional repressor